MFTVDSHPRGDHVVGRDNFGCKIVMTNLHCPVFPSTYATSRHTYQTISERPFGHINLVAIYTSNILIPNFSKRLGPRKSNFLTFCNWCLCTQ